MASKNNKAKSKGGVSEKAAYPIGLLFQLSTLAGCISFLLFSLSGKTDVSTALFRSAIVFIGFAFSIGLLMVVVVSILHNITLKEREEKIRLLQEEMLLQMQLHEEARQRKHEGQNAQSSAIPLGDGDN